jgi:AcrR family transcriptional regulator
LRSRATSFKNKTDLFDAVFERRARVLITARNDSLRSYVAGTRTVTVDGAVAAFINPMIDLLRGDSGWQSYFALVAQIDNTPWGGEIIHRFFDDSVHELIDILQKALPGSPKRELYWAYNFLAGIDDAGAVRDGTRRPVVRRAVPREGSRRCAPSIAQLLRRWISRHGHRGTPEWAAVSTTDAVLRCRISKS